MFTRFVLVVGDLDAPGLTAPADLHLSLDYTRVADLSGRGDRFVDCLRRPAIWHRNAVAREQLLALVLEQVHVVRLYCMGGWVSARRCLASARRMVAGGRC